MQVGYGGTDAPYGPSDVGMTAVVDIRQGLVLTTPVRGYAVGGAGDNRDLHCLLS